MADPSVRLAYNPGPINAYGALTPPPAGRLAVTCSYGALGPENMARNLGAPSGRLALADGQAERNGALEAPTVRLAFGNSPPERNGTSGLEAPTVRLAHGAQRDFEAAALMTPTASRADAPALLVSYVYLEPFLARRDRYHYRDWVLDSGAFSAHALGTVIDLGAYTTTCQELLQSDPTLSEVFALDVIGDWRASVRNAEAMWAAGVPAIPTFHVGTPWDVLLALVREYPKVALGGAVGYRKKLEWARQCFARIQRALGHLVPLHGFGFGSEEQIMALPWHSVDATNWEIGPCKYGRWQRFGQMSIRGSQQNLRAEVEWYLRLEARARVRWAAEMAKLRTHGPAVRLSVQQGSDAQVTRSGFSAPSVRPALSKIGSSAEPRYTTALPDARTVRLALAGDDTPGRPRYSRSLGEQP